MGQSIVRRALLALLLGAVGCTNGSSQRAQDASADAQTTRSGVQGGSCDGLPATTLDALFDRYFAPGRPTGCAVAGCHATGAGGFTFTTAHELWEASVGKPATIGGVRVKPGDPEHSVLYAKLLEGDPMRMPSGGPYLTATALAEVAGWICAGAPEPKRTEPDAGAAGDAAVRDAAHGGADASADAGGTGMQPGDPMITGFSPAEGVAGTMVTLSGTGFASDASANSVSFRGEGGTEVTAEVLSASPTSLVVTVPALAATGPIRVEVMGRATQSAQEFQVITVSPVPVLVSATPASAVAGSADLPITVHGSDFVAVSVVELDGQMLDTSFTDAGTLTATVPAAQLGSASSHTLTVTTRGPGGGTSAGLAFVVGNPLPVLDALVPASVAVGSGAVALMVSGSGFVPSSQIMLNGAAADTIYMSASVLAVSVPSALLASLGSVQVAVSNPAPGGGASNALVLTVGNPLPSLSSVTPSSALAGSGALALTLAGSDFVAGSLVQLDGASLPTVFDSATQLEASVDAAVTNVGGTHALTVFNPAPGGGVSASSSLVIENPAPALTSISPNQVATRGAALTLTVRGSGFNAASSVVFDGSARTTTFVDATTLTAEIPSITADGAYAVSVSNPAPGGGSSNRIDLTATTTSAPTITGVSPASALANSAFTLTVSGSGYVCSGSASQLFFNGAAVSVSSCSATQLAGAIPATPAGSYAVQVENGSTTSNSVSYPVVQPNPTPTLNSLDPASTVAGGAAFTLTVHGANFVQGAVVSWNGSARTTTFVSASEVSAAIAAADLSASGSAQVTVTNPAPGGGMSSALTFAIVMLNPAPSISGLDPASVLAGSGALHVRVLGSGFLASSSVAFNSNARTTTYVSSSELGVDLTSADTASAASDSITASNPAPGGGTSTPFTFTVVALNPAPTLSTLSPANTLVGGASFTLTLDGAGFVPSSSVSWNGVAKPTTYVSASRVTASISAADIASAGQFAVLVTNPAPGGGASSSLQFEVRNPAPSIGTLSPSTVNAGSGAFSLTVNGAGFVSGSSVLIDGNARVTHFVNTTQISADLLAADDASVTTHAITVQNATPGGGMSAAATLTVASQPNPVPTVTALSPCGIVAGAAQFTLSIQGSNFVSGASVSFNGSAVSATFGSATQLTATIPAALVASAPSNDAAPVVVTNPTPGGGASNSVTFGVATQNATLSGNVQVIFNTNCTRCHVAGGSGPMSLVAGAAYTSLVGADSGCSGKKRVLACGPLRSQSVLIDKIRATSASPACAGQPMPKGAPALSAAQQQLIVDWVAQGALQ